MSPVRVAKAVAPTAPLPTFGESLPYALENPFPNPLPHLVAPLRAGTALIVARSRSRVLSPCERTEESQCQENPVHCWGVLGEGDGNAPFRGCPTAAARYGRRTAPNHPPCRAPGEPFRTQDLVTLGEQRVTEVTPRHPGQHAHARACYLPWPPTMPQDPAVPDTISPPTTIPLRILVADDEESMRHFLARGLQRSGHQVEVADSGDAALLRWRAGIFDVAVLDLKMPGIDGLAALGRIRAADPEAIVLLMTAYGTVAAAVDAMHAGAADFLLKPFSQEELQVRLQRAIQVRRTARENRHLRAMLEPADGGTGLIGQSAAMRDLLRQVDLLRGSDATVLLTGESGTGKGLVAKALHLGSQRASEPFVAMNCAAVPDALVESELFGHDPGAFTGARAAKPGLLRRAHRGTLLLDEIADMSAPAQAKIERFLQEREFQPLGATEPVRVDVRILAATNRDLPALARSGAFRPELLWRLDVVQVRVPPLRERREDVPLLVAQNLRRFGRGGDHRLAAEATAALSTYDWPGNVRQLENVIERMVVMAGERRELGLADLPPECRGDVAPPGDQAREDYETTRQRFDRIYFEGLLRACGGRITEAAHRAGISRGHLHRRLRELGCDTEALRSEIRADEARGSS